MRVTVKLFATLKDFAPVQGLPGTPFELSLGDKATLQDVIRLLKLPEDQVKVTFVNGIIREADHPLNPGDEIGIFPPVGGGSMTEIHIDTWLYGTALAKYGREGNQGSFANLQVSLPDGSAMKDLLAFLALPSEERGITFINGDLSAMVGLQPDLNHKLKEGDRVALFHLNTMWPFQYRLGAAMIDEMQETMLSSKDQGLHHTYDTP